MESLSDKEVQEFEKQVQERMDNALEVIKKSLNSTLDDLYCDYIPHAYGDALTNFRNAMMEEIVSEGSSRYGYDKKELRQRIWKENKSELVKLLNADLLEENARLNNELDRLNKDRYLRKFV